MTGDGPDPSCTSHSALYSAATIWAFMSLSNARNKFARYAGEDNSAQYCTFFSKCVEFLLVVLLAAKILLT